jgi:hypothetical protein
MHFGGQTAALSERMSDESEGLDFPWRRLAAGLAACVVALLVGLALGQPPVPDWMPPALSLRTARTAAWLAASLLGSWAAVRWSLLAVGHSR